MSAPENLLFAKTHEWVKFLDNGNALIGISDHAQSQLGDIVFINLPEVGAEVAAGDMLCDIESVKAVSDIYSPVSGKVEKVNDELTASPWNINGDAYGAWIAEISGVTGRSELLTPDEYEQFAESEQ